MVKMPITLRQRLLQWCSPTLVAFHYQTIKGPRDDIPKTFSYRGDCQLVHGGLLFSLLWESQLSSSPITLRWADGTSPNTEIYGTVS